MAAFNRLSKASAIRARAPASAPPSFTPRFAWSRAVPDLAVLPAPNPRSVPFAPSAPALVPPRAKSGFFLRARLVGRLRCRRPSGRDVFVGGLFLLRGRTRRRCLASAQETVEEFFPNERDRAKKPKSKPAKGINSVSYLKMLVRRVLLGHWLFAFLLRGLGRRRGAYFFPGTLKPFRDPLAPRIGRDSSSARSASGRTG